MLTGTSILATHDSQPQIPRVGYVQTVSPTSTVSITIKNYKLIKNYLINLLIKQIILIRIPRDRFSRIIFFKRKEWFLQLFPSARIKPYLAKKTFHQHRVA